MKFLPHNTCIGGFILNHEKLDSFTQKSQFFGAIFRQEECFSSSM